MPGRCKLGNRDIFVHLFSMTNTQSGLSRVQGPFPRLSWVSRLPSLGYILMDFYDYPQYHWVPFTPVETNELEAIKSETVGARRKMRDSHSASSFYKWENWCQKENDFLKVTRWFSGIDSCGIYCIFFLSLFHFRVSASGWTCVLVNANSPSCGRSTRKTRVLWFIIVSLPTDWVYPASFFSSQGDLGNPDLWHLVLPPGACTFQLSLIISYVFRTKKAHKHSHYPLGLNS